MVNETTISTMTKNQEADHLGVIRVEMAATEGDPGGGQPVTELDEPKTLAGMPVRLLWVPYVILTILIVTLMLVSFIRFHRKNGHKYRQRMQFLKQINMQQLLNQIHNQVGGTNLPPNGGAVPGPSNSQQPQHNRPHPTRTRRPIAFQQGDTGSMVDLRISDGGASSIFKTPFSISSENSVWATLNKARAGPKYHGSHFGDSDDDDALLISTRL